VDEWSYSCPLCQNLKEFHELRKSANLDSVDHSQAFNKSVIPPAFCFQTLQKLQQQALTLLETQPPDRLSAIASTIEWGFGEIEWQLLQQADALQNPELPLNTSSQVQAEEWRIMAEELRRRGVLDESEAFYLKALDLNRLDYRMYVGLAETYLQSNQLEHAKNMLEKSLPHAPASKDFDYKSYSYRLIGHIYACGENYQEARSALRLSVQHSPRYLDGHYDAAQYAAQVGSLEDSLRFLQNILKEPIYFFLVQQERNFDPIRNDVQSVLFTFALSHDVTAEYDQGVFALAKYWRQQGNTLSTLSLLKSLMTRSPSFFSVLRSDNAHDEVGQDIQHMLGELEVQAMQEAENAMRDSEQALQAAYEAISETTQLAKSVGESYPLKSRWIYENAGKKHDRAKEKLATKGYVQLLEVASIAREVGQSGRSAASEAVEERRKYAETHSNRGGWNIITRWPNFMEVLNIIGSIFFWAFLAGGICMALEVLFALFYAISYGVFFGGIAVGMLIGLGVGIRIEGWRFKRLYQR